MRVYEEIPQGTVSSYAPAPSKTVANRFKKEKKQPHIYNK
jgi:hypothetical protein